MCQMGDNHPRNQWRQLVVQHQGVGRGFQDELISWPQMPFGPLGEVRQGYASGREYDHLLGVECADHGISFTKIQGHKPYSTLGHAILR